MHSNTLKKQQQSYTQDNAPQESPAAKRERIAQTAEAAAHLPGNINGPDFEEFIFKYNMILSSFV